MVNDKMIKELKKYHVMLKNTKKMPHLSQAV